MDGWMDGWMDQAGGRNMHMDGASMMYTSVVLDVVCHIYSVDRVSIPSFQLSDYHFSREKGLSRVCVCVSALIYRTVRYPHETVTRRSGTLP